jgi:hypothetical protein
MRHIRIGQVVMHCGQGCIEALTYGWWTPGVWTAPELVRAMPVIPVVSPTLAKAYATMSVHYPELGQNYAKGYLDCMQV